MAINPLHFVEVLAEFYNTVHIMVVVDILGKAMESPESAEDILAEN